MTGKYNFSYTFVMKTAISIPDQVFESAEKLASRLGQSRSQLYTQAISGFVEKHSTDNVTKKLDAIYAKTDVRLDLILQNAQFLSVTKDKW